MRIEVKIALVTLKRPLCSKQALIQEIIMKSRFNHLQETIKLSLVLPKLTCISSSETAIMCDPSAVLAEFCGLMYKFCMTTV